MTTQKKPHKHSELIKAWADGAEIECFDSNERKWKGVTYIEWSEFCEYRVKLEPKPDSIVTGRATVYKCDGDVGKFGTFSEYTHHSDNLKLTFDGETGKLKAAEVINK